MAGVFSYSKTASSNTSVDGISVAEGMTPGSVNNVIRAAVADIAEWRDDTGGQLTLAGGTTAYTLTTNGVVTVLADGIRLHAVVNASNTAASTLAVDGLAAKSIRKIRAGTGESALSAGDMTAGQHAIFQYDASANSAAGAWILVNPLSTPVTNVLDYGAASGGVGLATANSAAFAAATAAASTGQVFVPAGTYYVDDTITIATNGQRWSGESTQATIFKTEVANLPIFELTGSYQGLEHMLVQSDEYSTSGANIHLNGANRPFLNRVHSIGGWYPVHAEDCGDVVFIDNCFLFRSIGPANLFLDHSAAEVTRTSLDTSYPAGFPAVGGANHKGAWASLTAYSLKDIVSIDGGAIFIQCVSAGTSAALEPDVAVARLVEVTDGTAGWEYCYRAASAALLIDSSNYVVARDNDLTVAASYGIRQLGTGGSMYIINNEISKMQTFGILIEGASLSRIEGNSINSAMGTTSVGIYIDLDSRALGDWVIASNHMSNFDQGIVCGYSYGVRVQGNTLSAMTTGVRFLDGAQGFSIQGGNSFGDGYIGGACTTSIVINYTVYTGTVAVTATSVDVVGTGTAFLTNFAAGSHIYIVDTGERRIVDAVADNTNLTVTDAFDVTDASSTYATPPCDYYVIAMNVIGTAGAIQDTGIGVNKFVGGNV